MYVIMRKFGKLAPIVLADYPTLEQARADMLSRNGAGFYIQYSADAIARENAAFAVSLRMRKPRVCEESARPREVSRNCPKHGRVYGPCASCQLDALLAEFGQTAG